MYGCGYSGCSEQEAGAAIVGVGVVVRRYIYFLMTYYLSLLLLYLFFFVHF